MKLLKSRMKISDYLRLGKLSINARKKSTKNTIFGMCFGLILLIPMLFFAIAFYTDVSAKVNEVRIASSVNLNFKNINDTSASIPYREHSSEGDYREGVPAFSLLDDLTAEETVEDYQLAEYRMLPFLLNSNGVDIDLEIYEEEDSLTASSSTDIAEGEENGGNWYNDDTRALYELKIIFPELSSTPMFTEGELADYKAMTKKSNPFINLCYDGFTEETNGKGEIILSEIILKQWNIDKEDIANNYISIIYPEFRMGGNIDNYYMNFDNDDNPNNDYEHSDVGDLIQTYFCYRYKVVGIVSEEFYELPGKTKESHIWVTSSSVYYEEGRKDYVPIEYSINQSDNGTVITFDDEIEDVLEKNIDGGYMLFLQNLANAFDETYANSQQNFTFFNMRAVIQYESFEALEAALPDIKDILEEAYSAMSLSRFIEQYANEIFVQFRMIDQVGMIIIIVFTAIGGIILFTNILNLLNTVRYSVESRKNYIGVMRAIGAKSRVIPRLYMFEILIIFFRTFIITAIFSTGISVGIKYALDYAFAYLGEIFSFKINFIYFPIAFGAAFCVTLLVGLLFALTAAKVTAYQPILKTLYDEK